MTHGQKNIKLNCLQYLVSKGSLFHAKQVYEVPDN